MTDSNDPKRAPLAPPAAPRAPLPAERAFVVQLRADADPAHGVVRGRIEHLTSGAAAVFESVEQLLACMCEAMRRVGAGASHGAPLRKPAAPAADTSAATLPPAPPRAVKEEKK
jgi:hypothetical protein